MKSFTSFFTEARVSQASQQAERRGLTGDGHGNWMDKEGNIVARTEQGRLVLLDKKVKAPQQEAPKKVRKANRNHMKSTGKHRRSLGKHKKNIRGTSTNIGKTKTLAKKQDQHRKA